MGHCTFKQFPPVLHVRISLSRHLTGVGDAPTKRFSIVFFLPANILSGSTEVIHLIWTTYILKNCRTMKLCHLEVSMTVGTDGLPFTVK